MQQLVEDEYRNGKVIAESVTKWFEHVKNLFELYDEFLQDKRLPYTMCSKGYFPKPGMRYRVAKKAYRLASKVDSLCNTSFPDGISSGQRPVQIDLLSSVVNFESFNSRKEVTENITKALKDANIKMVGVYGMGGVGKTTLVKKVANEARRDKLFGAVIFATVTSNSDINKIQGELADQLGVRLNEETETIRAGRLGEIFKKERKNILVILDDLWAELDLNKLGIPIDDVNLSPNNITMNQMSIEGGTIFDEQAEREATGDSKMLKILLISRNKEVVCNKMQVKENSSFLIKGLEGKEIEILFKKEVGMVDKPPEFEPLAYEISNKCGGLPIAIVTIAKILQSKSYSQWKEMLSQLEQQGFTEVDKSIYSLIRESFDYLENEELKSTFLLCAQLGYHPPIMDLVKLCIGMSISEGFLTMKETREKVLRLIKKLKNASLLLDSYTDDRFNMDDVIREIALSIASKERHLFTMRNGELKEWPHENEFEKYVGISIHNCNINDKLPNSVSCTSLKFFRVDSLVNPSFIIPEGFFQQARQLRALILTGVDISNFGASTGCLTDLRILCFEKCKLGDISFIGKLEKLRILSLSGSMIESLPIELGKLHKLQLLDIRDCSELREIPPNVLSSLINLEELYVGNSLKGAIEENQGENNILAELKNLHGLNTLDICLRSAAVLPRLLDKLDSYKIVIGDFLTLSVGDFKMPVKDEASRVLALQKKESNVFHCQKGVKMLFRKVDKMLLGQLNGVRYIFYELTSEEFPCLKELCIVDNSYIEYMIDPKEVPNLNDVFPILESLFLYRLENMLKIMSHSTNLSSTSFSRLKVVRIHCCRLLENVFPLSMVLLLKNVETIDISECMYMKSIVPKEEHDTKIEFPKLRSLALNDLPDFIGVYSNDDDVEYDGIILFNELVEIPNLESLELSSIHMMTEISIQSKSFENLTKLNMERCGRIRYLFSFSMAKSMKKLKCLSVSCCDEMTEIFKYEIEDMLEARNVHVFPKLEEIYLKKMDQLTSIWPSEASPDSFASLNSLSIELCCQLVTVVPSHMVGRFGRLESLRIVGCHAVEQIFDLNGTEKPNVGDETNLQVLQIDNLKNLKRIWNGDPEGILNFKKLHIIGITCCQKLEYLFPVSVAKGLQELNSLSISNCPQMEEIAHGDEKSNDENFKFPQVSVVEMKLLPKLKHFYKGRHSVEWPELKKLSVFGGHQLEAFFPDEIIPKLETLEMNLKEVEKLQPCIKNYRMNHLKNFLLVSCPSLQILYQFLCKKPYLERLTLCDGDLKELIPIQENVGRGNPAIQEMIGDFPRLKYLKLSNLNALENIGFEREEGLQDCLEHLYIRGCEKLINLAPSSVTFTCLTTLEVHQCKGMKTLMGFSTAKNLVQLVSLNVFGCLDVKSWRKLLHDKRTKSKLQTKAILFLANC